jgi:hypothetical protein
MSVLSRPEEEINKEPSLNGQWELSAARATAPQALAWGDCPCQWHCITEKPLLRVPKAPSQGFQKRFFHSLTPYQAKNDFNVERWPS